MNSDLRVLCGSVALWLVWLCGSVALWLCGSVALWLCGSVGESKMNGVDCDSDPESEEKSRT